MRPITAIQLISKPYKERDSILVTVDEIKRVKPMKTDTNLPIQYYILCATYGTVLCRVNLANFIPRISLDVFLLCVINYLKIHSEKVCSIPGLFNYRKRFCKNSLSLQKQSQEDKSKLILYGYKQL